VSLSSQTFTAIVIQTSLITATEMLTLPLISDQIIPLLPNRPSLFGFQELDQNQPRRTFRQTSEISSIFFFFFESSGFLSLVRPTNSDLSSQAKPHGVSHPFHQTNKVPVADGPYARAKKVQASFCVFFKLVENNGFFLSLNWVTN
jgi:hypothetical protein